METRVEIRTEDLLSVPQAAKCLNRPKITLYRWIEKGQVVAIELGGVLFIPKKEMERLKNEHNAKLKTETGSKGILE